MTEFMIFVAATISVATIVFAGMIWLANKYGVFDGRDPDEQVHLGLWRAKRKYEKAAKEWEEATKD